MTNPAARLIRLILVLERRPNQKAAELAEKLGVSIRTIHRYIRMLEDMGIPVYSERGPYGGFSLARGYKIPPLIFSPQEAVAIFLGTDLVTEMWGNLYKEAAEGALAKLDNVLPEEQRQEIAWARRTLVVKGMHRTIQESLYPNLGKLRQAIRERKRVRITYRSRNQPDALKRDVDFYALVHQWGWWYCIGFCHLRNAMRYFRVDRIIELRVTELVFELSDIFDIHAYLEKEPYAKTSIHVQMKFFPSAALIANDDRLNWEEMDEQVDGSVLVSFVAPNLEWAARMVLGYGTKVVVIDPPELYELLRRKVEEIAKFYISE